MNAERWKRIDSLFQAALERRPEEREVFLRNACQGDDELHREVLSLLGSHEMAGAFLESHVMDAAARELAFEWRREADCQTPPVESPSAAPRADEGQLSPGALFAERYTIVELVGRGGMGEVYRARDNQLEQVVALKLLAEPLRRNTAALVALRNEVRLARQVTHPNVCRVYDIGEAGGLHFLTMEFIDGDDLAYLLKRIGRFPPDKGIEIARRICAALSAAHERGVLHRDLKPGNIMLNASGDVLVTDFGLAAALEDVPGFSPPGGTPAYMSPEQAAGGKVTVRSDIYSLGLVLYELFTGQQPAARGRRAPLPNPSSLVNDLDPEVEHVILRCLAEHPEDRPATALAVMTLLPGGDPLAVALAAGQTPPPEIVAASGEKAGISVRSAAACLAAALGALFGTLVLGSHPQVSTRAPIELPADGLAVKAREIAASVGYAGRPAADGSGFLYDTAQIRRLDAEGWSTPALSRPSPIRFWYREAPRALASYEMKGLAWADPPQNVPGMISMQMDGAGRLTFFRARVSGIATASGAPSSAAPPEPDWTVLLKAAGLNPHSIQPAAPEILPDVFADMRSSWNGCYADQAAACVRVEAAALAGHPVYFRVLPAWEPNAVDPANLDVGFQLTARPYPPSYPGRVVIPITMLAFVVGLVAWRNLNSGRGDRRGAFRVAAILFVLWMVYGVSIGFGQLSGAPERSWLICAHALFWSGTAWLLYIALEPRVRRSWPHSLVSWSRLLSGRVGDPLVGRDVLIGILVASCFFLFRSELPITIGSAIPPHIGLLVGIIPVALAISASGALTIAVVFTFTLVISRRKWAAFLATSIVFFNMNYFLARPGEDWVQVCAIAMYSLLTVAVLARVGVLACYTAMTTAYLLFALPPGLDFDAWYQDDARLNVLLLSVLTLFSFHSALAGRPLLKPNFE